MDESIFSGKEAVAETERFSFGAQQPFAEFNPFLGPQKILESDLPDIVPRCEDAERSTRSSSPSISRCSTLANLSDASGGVELIIDKKRPLSPRTSTSVKAIASGAVEVVDLTEPSPKRVKMSWDLNRSFHESLLFNEDNSSARHGHTARLEEVKTTPLFSANVLRASLDAAVLTLPSGSLPQYGLLAGVQDMCGRGKHTPDASGSDSDYEQVQGEAKDSRLFLNTNTPWSAFICGSQGSGKSHTLSCMLEAAILQSRNPNKLGELPNPLAGIVFHYDKFTGLSGNQVCEAAYLCSTGIPVKVLVSPASLGKMQELYSKLPGIPNHLKPTVHPLLFEQQHLNAARMLNLMAVEGTDGARPLYMEARGSSASTWSRRRLLTLVQVVCRVLRQIAMTSQGREGFSFEKFQYLLGLQLFNPGQMAMLDTRLDLLQDFMQPKASTQDLSKATPKPQFKISKEGKEKERNWENEEHKKRQAAMVRKDTWSFKPGSLTIVDLSCPFVDEKTACDLFQMCLAIFLETRGDTGRIVALDEAHKFMNDADSASSSFTESLLSVIRQQRHLATRVIIATQEPTISPKLLDLSSMTIVHRFTSPHWFQTLKAHLAGVSPLEDEEGRDLKEIFRKIVDLEAGEALLFSPSMMLNVTEGGTGAAKVLQTEKLGMGYLKMRVRKRLTADGGRSILAT